MLFEGSVFKDVDFEKFKLYDEKYKEFDRKIGAYKSWGNITFHSVEKAKLLHEGVSSFLKDIDGISADSEIESIIKKDLFEKVNFLIKSLNSHINPNDTNYYEDSLFSIGITSDDIDLLAKDVFSRDIKGIIKEANSADFEISFSRVITEKERKTAKEILIKLLELSYNNYEPAGSFFKDFKDYLNFVDFKTVGGSVSRSDGVAVFSYNGLDLIKRYNGFKQVIEPFVYKFADLVGEEGLLGHQGHRFCCLDSELFFLSSQATITNTCAEFVGAIGSDMCVSMAKENEEIMDFMPTLREEADFFQRVGLKSARIKRFMKSYIHYQAVFNKKSFREIFDELYSITGDTSYKSEKCIKLYETNYLADFWKGNLVKIWVYPFSRGMADKFYPVFSKKDKEVKNNIIKDLHTAKFSYHPMLDFIELVLKKHK